MTRSDPPPGTPGRRWEAATLLGGVLLAVLWTVAPRDPHSPAAEAATAPAAARDAESSPAAAGWNAPVGTARRPTSVDPPTASVPAVVDSSRWMSRIRTNGVFDPTRPSNDPDHAQAWLRHRQLRSLVKSPARDTAECAAVVALAERHGLSLAAVPDLYNALWEVRNLERQMQESQSPAQAGGLESIKLLELEDFMNRFRRDFAVDPNPVFGELLGLGLHPSVFFGVPDVSARPGEPLLTD